MVFKAFICLIFVNNIVFGKYLLANVKERAIGESISNQKGMDYMFWGGPGVGVISERTEKPKAFGRLDRGWYGRRTHGSHGPWWG